MKVIACWLVMFGAVAAGLVLNDVPFKAFFQITSALLVLVPTATYLVFGCGGFMGFFHFCQRVLKNQLTDGDSPLIDTTATIGFLFGGVGAVVGMIGTMIHLADTSKLGAGVATSYVSVLYGILPAVLLLPVKKHTSTKNQTLGFTDPMVKKAAGFTGMTLMMLLFTFFVVLYATSQHDLAKLK